MPTVEDFGVNADSSMEIMLHACLIRNDGLWSLYMYFEDKVMQKSNSSVLIKLQLLSSGLVKRPNVCFR